MTKDLNTGSLVLEPSDLAANQAASVELRNGAVKIGGGQMMKDLANKST